MEKIINDVRDTFNFFKPIYSYAAGFGAFVITNSELSKIDANTVSPYLWSVKRLGVRLAKVTLPFTMAKLAKETMESFFDHGVLYAEAIIEAEEKMESLDE